MDSPTLCTEWLSTTKWRSCKIFGLFWVLMWLQESRYEIPLVIGDPTLICLQMYTVGIDVNPILTLSWGSLANLSGIDASANVFVDHIAVVYHLHCQFLVYACEESLMTVADDPSFEEPQL